MSEERETKFEQNSQDNQENLTANTDDQYSFHSDYYDDDDYSDDYSGDYADYYEDNWDDDIRLHKIDEIVARTGLSFSEAKECLEAFDYNIVETLAAIDEEKSNESEEAKQKLKEKYEFFKNFSKEKYSDIKDFSKESCGQIKNKMQNGDLEIELDQIYGKLKDAACQPVQVTSDGKKLPAGVLGASAVSLLYPLHKSKALAALGLGAVGVWAMKKHAEQNGKANVFGNAPQNISQSLKNTIDKFTRNFADSFNGLTAGNDDDNCFIITVEDDFSSKNRAQESDEAEKLGESFDDRFKQYSETDSEIHQANQDEN